MERFRPALRDTKGAVTPEGRKVHDLILADRLLKNDEDPKVDYAMSPGQRAKYTVAREHLLVDLSVPEKLEEREEKLHEMHIALIREKLPFWRILPGQEDDDIGM